MKLQSDERICTVELKPGEKLVLPASLADVVGPGRWVVSVRPYDASAETGAARRHDAFLNGYAPQDEGLYDDLAR